MFSLIAANDTLSKSSILSGAWAATAIVVLKALGKLVLYTISLTTESKDWIFNSCTSFKFISSASTIKSTTLSILPDAPFSTCMSNSWLLLQAPFISSHIFFIKLKIHYPA